MNPTCIANTRVGPVASMWKTRNKDFAPRAGFAYDVFGNGKTAVRGSYGIFYDRIFDNVWSNGAWNPPFYALVDFDASGSDPSTTAFRHRWARPMCRTRFQDPRDAPLSGPWT